MVGYPYNTDNRNVDMGISFWLLRSVEFYWIIYIADRFISYVTVVACLFYNILTPNKDSQMVDMKELKKESEFLIDNVGFAVSTNQGDYIEALNQQEEKIWHIYQLLNVNMYLAQPECVLCVEYLERNGKMTDSKLKLFKEPEAEEKKAALLAAKGWYEEISALQRRIIRTNLLR